MRVVSDLAKGSFPNGTVATIGAYDGVHLGHQTVIAGIRSLAVERGCASVVVTFDRHPASVVRPESAPKLLTDLHQKLELLAATGVDATVVVPFDTTMAARSATEFVDLVLVRCANARAVVVGEDFHFGHRRVGNVALLQELGATRGFTTTGVPLVARPDSTGSAVRLSTEALNNPFAYQLTLHEPAGERVVDVDMLETARLLLGLVPKRQRELKDKAGLRHQLMEAVLAADLARGLANPAPVLLWLRPVVDGRTDAVAKAEHAWLAQAVQTEFKRTLQDYATIFHNRAAFWPNGGTGGRGTSIDALLAARMMERAL